MTKKKILIIVIAVVVIILIGLSLSYFFHTSVEINSDFEVYGIVIEDENGQSHKDSTRFSHFATYGSYLYYFVAADQKIYVKYVKTNSYKHSNIVIDIRRTDDKNVIRVDVKRDGILEKSELFNIVEKDGISVNIGP